MVNYSTALQTALAREGEPVTQLLVPQHPPRSPVIYEPQVSYHTDKVEILIFTGRFIY